MNPLKHKLANEWMRQDDATHEEALDTWNTMEAEFKLNRAALQEPRTMAQEPRNMAHGGRIIGKPGGIVEPGIEYYGKLVNESPSSKNTGNTSPVKKGKFIHPRTNRWGTVWSDTPHGGAEGWEKIRTPRDQGIQIKLLEATNKSEKFNAAKFAKDNNISMKELKKKAELLQGSIYDKRMLDSGKDMGRLKLKWIPQDVNISDNALSKLHASGLIVNKRSKIENLFYDAFGREYNEGTKIKNPTWNKKKHIAIKNNLTEYYQLKKAINAKYPSINFELDHPLSRSTLNKIFNASAEELTRVNVLDAHLNNSFKDSLSRKYEKAVSSKNFRAKKAVEKVARDLKLNIGKVSTDLKDFEYGVKEFQKLNIRDEIIKSLKNQKDLNYNFKSYIKNNPELLKIAGFEDPSKIGTKLTKVTDKHIQGVEKILTQAGFNIDKCLSSGGRVNLKFGKGVNSCITGVIEAEQKKAMQGNKISKAKFGKFGKAARFAGWFLGPVDLAVELAFALPHMLQGDKEAAKRATTYGLLGWGEKKLDEIKADSPEAYKYAKHVKDNDAWVDAWFSQQDAEQNLEVLKNVPEGSQVEKTTFYTNQLNTAINTMAQIQEGYVGYVDEEGKFDRMGGTKGKISLQDYLREDVKKKTDAGFQIDIDLPSYQKKNVAGIAPFKGGQPIANLEQYIEQKNEPYWKSGLEHAAYEAGVPDLFDTFMQGADKKDPRDLYSELPLKYASQLGKMEAEETRRLLARKKAKEEADEAAERYGPYTRFAEGGIMNLKKNKW